MMVDADLERLNQTRPAFHANRPRRSPTSMRRLRSSSAIEPRDIPEFGRHPLVARRPQKEEHRDSCQRQQESAVSREPDDGCAPDSPRA